MDPLIRFTGDSMALQITTMIMRKMLLRHQELIKLKENMIMKGEHHTKIEMAGAPKKVKEQEEMTDEETIRYRDLHNQHYVNHSS